MVDELSALFEGAEGGAAEHVAGGGFACSGEAEDGDCFIDDFEECHVTSLYCFEELDCFLFGGDGFGLRGFYLFCEHHLSTKIIYKKYL